MLGRGVYVNIPRFDILGDSYSVREGLLLSGLIADRYGFADPVKRTT